MPAIPSRHRDQRRRRSRPKCSIPTSMTIMTAPTASVAIDVSGRPPKYGEQIVEEPL